MAHYEGETLKERIARGPLALDDAVDIATQIGQGLAEVSQHDNLARSGGWQVGTVLRAFLAGFKEANRWQNNTARSTGGCS